MPDLPPCLRNAPPGPSSPLRLPLEARTKGIFFNLDTLYLAGTGWADPQLLEALTTNMIGLLYSVTVVGSNDAGQSFAVWGLNSM